MSNDTPRRRGSRSHRHGRRKRGLALLVASVAGLAAAAPGNAQLGATQSQSGSNGALQAVVTNVQVTGNTVQVPVRVNAPVRVLSPGNNAGGGDAAADTGNGGGPASQSQSGSNGAAQAGVTNVQVAGNTVQAPVRVVGPIRILSPGEDRLDAGATATADGGDGSASQSQNGENGALQALLTSIQVIGITAQAPISVYAPVRVLSPGDNDGGATASADTGGGGGGPATQTQNGENGTAQAGVTNVQIAENTAEAPVAATVPVRVLSPGGDTTGGGPGGGSGGGGGPGGDGGSGPGGGELGAGARGSASGSVIETLPATAAGGSLPFTGAPVGLLALLGASLLLLGLRLRASGVEAVR
jgi:hypothetical protein